MSQELADLVRAVLDAARGLVSGVRNGEDPIPLDDALTVAVDALDAWKPAAIESDRPWREVLPGDEVASPLNGQWYRVVTVYSTGRSNPNRPALHSGNAVVIELEVNGTTKKYRKDGSAKIRTRRVPSPEGGAITALQAAGFDVSTLRVWEER